MRKTIDIGGIAHLTNKWEKDKLLNTKITKGFIQNIPNQKYLDVSFSTFHSEQLTRPR